MAKQRNLKNVGIDTAAISYDQYLTLQSKLGKIELVPATKELELIRCIKDDDEVEYIRKAAEIASNAYNSLLASIKPNMEERDLALELEFKMRSGGSESVAFDIIFASGPNSAMPHAKPGRRKLAVGDLIIADYGGNVSWLSFR